MYRADSCDTIREAYEKAELTTAYRNVFEKSMMIKQSLYTEGRLRDVQFCSGSLLLNGGIAPVTKVIWVPIWQHEPRRW
jgi:hypothetical protein